MAGELGFEPRLTESESAVLPLDDPPAAGRRCSREPAGPGEGRAYNKFLLSWVVPSAGAWICACRVETGLLPGTRKSPRNRIRRRPPRVRNRSGPDGSIAATRGR